MARRTQPRSSRYDARVMKHPLAWMLCVLSLFGCDRILGNDDPPPAAVAPIAPPTVVVRTNAPSEVALFVDGRAAGPLTDGRSLQLDPGPHVFEARRQNEVVARAERTLAAGDQVEVALNVTEPDPTVQQAVQDGSGSRPATAPDRETPSRADVVASMRAVTPAIRACGDGAGLVPVRFGFRGDGSVESATASGSASATVRSCVEAAARGARLPPFRREAFSVTYPFRL